MKNSDRTEALRRILQDNFEPRFSEIARKLRGELQQYVASEHPVFHKLQADDKSSKYVAVTRIHSFNFPIDDNLMIAATPKYGECYEMPTGGYLSYSSEANVIGSPDTPIPCGIGRFTSTDTAIYAEYVNTWKDYLAARMRLSQLLNSYKTREKLIADFPEFGKYFPIPVAKAKLPMVIVDDVRNDLKALGVPCSK